MHGFIDPPPPPPPDPDRERPEPPGSERRSERRRPESPLGARGWNLHLESAGTDVPVAFLAGSPSTAVLAVEDVCWQAAVEDWKHRRPPRWRLRARSAWRAEGGWLAARADHLRRLAGEVLREL